MTDQKDRHYLDDRPMQQTNAEGVRGEALTPQAKHQQQIVQQVNALKERASVLQVPLAELVHLQDTGAITNNPLPVPQEFRNHLQEQAQNLQHVQHAPVQQPQVPDDLKDHPLYQKMQQQQFQQPQAQPAPSQQMAPAQQPPIVNQTTVAQPQQQQATEIYPEDLLADVDLMMGMNPITGSSGDYEDVSRVAPQPPTQQIGQKIATGGSGIKNLKNPLWHNVDNLILWESFYGHLIDAERHMLNDSQSVNTLKKRIANFQRVVDEKGEEYLKEIEKRARHRNILTRNRTAFGWHPAQVAQIVKDYQELLGPVNMPVAPTNDESNSKTADIFLAGIEEATPLSDEAVEDEQIKDEPDTGVKEAADEETTPDDNDDDGA